VREELIERDRTTTISPSSVTASVSPIVLNISPFEFSASTQVGANRRTGPSVTRGPSCEEAACGMGHLSKLD